MRAKYAVAGSLCFGPTVTSSIMSGDKANKWVNPPNLTGLDLEIDCSRNTGSKRTDATLTEERQWYSVQWQKQIKWETGEETTYSISLFYVKVSLSPLFSLWPNLFLSFRVHWQSGQADTVKPWSMKVRDTTLSWINSSSCPLIYPSFGAEAFGSRGTIETLSNFQKWTPRAGGRRFHREKQRKRRSNYSISSKS